MNSGLEGAEDVSVGVVTYGAGEDPADMNIGEVQGGRPVSGERLAACPTRRRALSRDQPVTDIT